MSVEGETTGARLRPWPQLQRLLPPLSAAEFDALRKSIEEDGLRVPILALRDGRIVDGHHRLKACEELGLNPVVQVLDLDDASAFRLGLALNVSRRHLSVEQLREVREWQRRTYLEARRGGKTQAEAAALAGVSRATGCWWETTVGRTASPGIMSFPDLRVKVGPQARREIARRIRAGEDIQKVATDYSISVRHVRRITRELKLPLDVQHAAYGSTGEPEIRIIAGDMSLLEAEVGDEEAALVITDPPYPRDYLGLYGRLAQLASRKLKPGGICVAYCGHAYLPEILDQMLRYLRFYWLCGVGPFTHHPPIWPRKIWAAWRPVLLMQKPPAGERAGRWLVDFVAPGRKTKAYHEWEQAVEPFAYFIQRLTEPKDLVLDPFVGSGTTALACKMTGRRFIGTEIDGRLAEIARRRVLEVGGGTELEEVGS